MSKAPSPAFSASAEEIFCAALELAAPARPAFVEQACAGRPGLRAEVERLLSAQPAASEFFSEMAAVVTGAGEAGPAAPAGPGFSLSGGPEETLGTRIGPYRLLQVLGEGGCGVVYLAEQETPVHRQVALKIIKLGMDTRSVIARFDAERQALALMDHPDITRVLDADTTDKGRPYFVMELVRGLKITGYCDQQRLNLNQRLQLFIQVCQALQHAHQKGIIHRDVKPSNILVTVHDGKPMPKVIDFGIAKAVEGRLTDELLTACEQFIGTPAYMSPEQAQMGRVDVDTRSDLYSLGVLLHELLVGRTQFDLPSLRQASVDELRRMLRERDPQRPSLRFRTLPAAEQARIAQCRQAEPARLVSRLRGDLDWIVLKALENDRNRRYQTANAIAADVQRHLDHEPVTARPPSRWYRFQKLVRRHQLVFALGVAFTLALAAGLGITLALLLRERELRSRAVAAEAREARLRAAAERQSKWREEILQAAQLINQGDFTAADQVIAQLSLEPTTMEGEEVLRSLAQWNVFQGRWPVARDRYHTWQAVSRFDTPIHTSLGFTEVAVVLLECHDQAEYARLCSDLSQSVTSQDDLLVVERAVKNCLLVPAPPELIRRLTPLAAIVETQAGQENFSKPILGWEIPWRCLTLALWEYRRGDPAQAEVWANRSLRGEAHPPVRAASARVIRAMALSRLGRPAEARAELDKARLVIEPHFKMPLEEGTVDAGYWFDWEVSKLLLAEATALLNGETPNP